jgi:cytochrome c-type biogenesis protein CcsB
MRRLYLLLALLTLGAFSMGPLARADTPPGLDELGTIAIQDGGRVMPLEAFARRIAVQLTGRTRWSASRGPDAFAGRSSMQLLCDLMFDGQALLHKPLIAVENRPFKRRVGLDLERRFFTPVELASNKGINELLGALAAAREKSPDAQATRDQRRASEIRDAVERAAGFADRPTLAIVPAGPGQAFRRVGAGVGDPGTEPVQAALSALREAYLAGRPVPTQVHSLRQEIAVRGTLSASDARAVRLEVFYDRHQPYRLTGLLYGLAIVLLGVSRLTLRRLLTAIALATAAAGVAEHLLGVGLRIAILDRAPVSNTYESLLWMGLVGIAIGVVAQWRNRAGWYLFAGLCAALVSVLFAGLVPLGDRTNSLPAVLRSNFWLTIHVLTIVASYGALAVASVLGHVYLAKEILLARGIRRAEVSEATPSSSQTSAPLIVQTYRTIQVGLVLLTAGTILGGVWAAESWGRFWGWDPKETWALISILTYFTVLHARYVGWIMDFGLAAAAVLGFVVIVWTFYGVNYVMATGLHSYGFGSGGELWVGLWAAAEIVFLGVCRVRLGLQRSRRPSHEDAPAGRTRSLQG